MHRYFKFRSRIRVWYFIDTY